MAMSECSSQKKAMSIDCKKVPTCWGNAQTPFAFPFLRVSNSISVSPALTLSELGSSFASAADRFLRTIHLLASQNPIVNKFLSLSSQFHSLCAQIRCSQFRKVSYLSTHNFAAVLPGDSVAGLLVANGIINFLNIYNTLLIVRLVLTWFPNSPPAIVSPLSTICDPYLNIFRGLIPPLGGTLDLSPILAFLVLNAFTSTAAALPAELPGTDNSQQSLVPSSQLTTSQRKWMRRLQGNKSRDSSGFN